MLELVRGPSHQIANHYIDRLANVLELVPRSDVARAINLLHEARLAGRRVYLIGNGGSAATASHLACDLTKTTRGALPALRAISLVANASVLTAWANDVAYERVFAEQIRDLVEPQDVVLAISASGNSPNVIWGLVAATEARARTIGLLGFDGGRARSLVEIAIHIPCNDYGVVEDVHAAIGHAITAALRDAASEPPAGLEVRLPVALHGYTDRAPTHESGSP